MQGERKKILQISKYYWPEVGGIEKVAEAISDAVAESYEMKVLCYTRDNKDSVDYVKGGEIIRCGSKCKVSSQPISLSIVKKLRRILGEYNPDYVIIHEPNPYMTFFLMRLITPKVKLIVYWHSDIIKQRFGERLLRKLYLKEMRKAESVIATSPNYIEGSIYLSSVKDKCVIVPNCVNEKQLDSTENSRAIAEKVRNENKGKIICVGIGRVVPYKGFEYLAKVARVVGDKFVFYISGRADSSTPIIKEMIRGLDNFYLLGETSDDEQKGYLEACDIFCFPSITKNEAFGIALAEGMYFGKPAVTFTIEGSGVNYVSINGKTGIEVENKNVEEYAKALIRLAENPILREKYGNAARKRIQNMFTYERYRESIVETLEMLK